MSWLYVELSNYRCRYENGGVIKCDEVLRLIEGVHSHPSFEHSSPALWKFCQNAIKSDASRWTRHKFAEITDGLFDHLWRVCNRGVWETEQKIFECSD